VGILFSLAAALGIAGEPGIASENNPPPGVHRGAPLAGTAGKSPARAAFERLKELSGTWRGRSTRGWTDQVTMDVIAGGSVVRQVSFDAHPGETMLTLFHLNGGRLMLTHYCVAGNQPRMVAHAFEEGGAVIRFDFLDATNLPTADAGHMHRAVFRLDDHAHFRSQWTFMKDGKESWQEEIHYERLAP
jgi:hypothetical protein